MQKVKFVCDECEVKGQIGLGDDYDDYPVAYCPSCGSPLENDGDLDLNDE